MDDTRTIVKQQQPTTRGCRYCGEPMLKTKGNITQKVKTINGKETVIEETIATDQRVLFHKKCRREGRRMAHKQAKWLRKELKNKNK